MTISPSHHSFEPSKRTIHGHVLYSAHLQEERTIKVVLPPNVETFHRLPVVYCHDGGEFLTHGRLVTLSGELMAQGELRPMVIVAIHVNKARRTDDYAPNGSRTSLYNRFVVEECLPFIADNYPVAITSDKTFMAGISLGAAASITLHLDYPDRFTNLVLFSGAFYESSLERIRNAVNLDDLACWMIVGSEETTVETDKGTFDFYRLNHLARDLLKVRGADVTYGEADGTHIWGFWQKHIPDALRWMERRMRLMD